AALSAFARRSARATTGGSFGRVHRISVDGERRRLRPRCGDRAFAGTRASADLYRASVRPRPRQADAPGRWALRARSARRNGASYAVALHIRAHALNANVVSTRADGSPRASNDCSTNRASPSRDIVNTVEHRVP